MDGIGKILESTMLIERSLGGLTFLVFLFFFTVQISRSSDLKSLKYHLDWYLFFICILSFFYIPGDSSDLFRLRAYGNAMSDIRISWAFKDILGSTTPVGYFLIYICQKTGIDGLLPLVVGFIFYYNAFYIIRKVVECENLSNSSAAFGVLFLMCSGYFVQVISGVRSLTAYAIVARCIIDEIYDDKAIYRNIIWYLISFLMHLSVMPLICIRIFCYLFEKGLNKKKIALICIAGCLLAVPAYMVSSHIRYFVEKALGYLMDSPYIDLVEYIIAGSYFILIMIFAYVYRHRYTHTSIALDNLYRLVMFYGLLELVFCFEFSILNRYVCFSIFMVMPLVMASVEKLKKDSPRIVTIIGLVMIAIVLFACFRGNLSSYKYFKL